MKKLLILLLMLFPLVAESATITATKAGNWSDTSVWDLGRIPAAGDDVALAGYVIVWDTSLVRIPSTSGTLTSISSTGTAGRITLALDNAAFHGGASLYATTITGGSYGGSPEGIISISGTTDHVLTITVGTDVGQGVIGGSTTNYSCGVYHNGTGTVNIIGNIIGGSVSAAACQGFRNHSTGSVNVTGNLTAGSKGSAFWNNGTGTVSITGNITASSSIGFDNNSTGVVTINNGIITGGSVKDVFGFYNRSTAKVTLGENVRLVQGSYAPPYSGYAPAWQPASTSYAKFYTGALFGQAANTEFPQGLAAGNIKAGVVSGSVTGTLASGGGFPILGGSVVR
jgi:hypothetical protein